MQQDHEHSPFGDGEGSKQSYLGCFSGTSDITQS